MPCQCSQRGSKTVMLHQLCVGWVRTDGCCISCRQEVVLTVAMSRWVNALYHHYHSADNDISTALQKTDKLNTLPDENLLKGFVTVDAAWGVWPGYLERWLVLSGRGQILLTQLLLGWLLLFVVLLRASLGEGQTSDLLRQLRDNL